MTKQTGNPQLVEFIRARIERDGPVTFECFMEQALYHPRHGYYSSARARIGRRGDYLTNVSVGSVFGELLARQFYEMWEALGRPEPFTIVEQGAHSGDFACDVLRCVARRMPEFAAALRYCIVEPFPAALQSVDCRVRWCAKLDELEPFCGVHFSNELVDAMPVHLVRRTASGWNERYVTTNRDIFEFADGDCQLPAALLPDVAPPYETELNLRMRDWIAAVSQKLTRGYVLGVDYGYPRDEYYAPHRSTGTLRCYAQHRVIESPLLHVGEADITAHVEWTSVARHGLEAGLQLSGFTDQHHFLTGILSTFGDGELTQLNRNQLQTLLQPTMLGRAFQFLALSKDAPVDAKLSGFKFARDPQIALGLHTAC